MFSISTTVDGVFHSDDVEPRMLLVDGELHPVQKAFHDNHGLQCGYCTAGMIVSAVDLLMENPDPTEEEVREGLEGNLCRCTGYHNIVKAVRAAAAELSGASAVPAEAVEPEHLAPGRDRPEDAIMRDLTSSGPGVTVRSGAGRPDARGRPRLSPGSPPSARDRGRSHAHARHPARASDAMTIG